ncbi:hypothetical protein HD554DRAFT_2169421 [Boletus coccyginus]|nr:hypothetical protein HD554DRAFT_2169421 [Boletus coccyginus]
MRRKEKNCNSRCRIKPTIHTARFVHQAGQQRALLEVKEIAAEPPSVKPSTDQSDAITLSPVASPEVTPPSSEAPLASLLHPVSSPMTALSPSMTPPSTEQLDASASSSVVDPMCASPEVLPRANQTTAGPSCITEMQIDPILLALSTALTLDLESTDEVDNEDTPPPSQSLDIPIVGVPTANVPTPHSLTGDAPEANQSTPSTPTSGQQTARINSILAACYDELDRILMKAVGETSCSVQQVLDSWNKSHGRVITATNHWNLWPSYLAKYKKEEHLREGIPMDAPLTPSLHGRLYMKFKEANKDNWQEILEIHSMLELSEPSSTMVHQQILVFAIVFIVFIVFS